MLCANVKCACVPKPINAANASVNFWLPPALFMNKRRSSAAACCLGYAIRAVVPPFAMARQCPSAFFLLTTIGVASCSNLRLTTDIQVSMDDKSTDPYDGIRQQIRAAVHENLEVIGPALIRLAWHSAGTYDPTHKPHGGASGATMRFGPESDYEDNNGLEV